MASPSAGTGGSTRARLSARHHGKVDTPTTERAVGDGAGRPGRAFWALVAAGMAVGVGLLVALVALGGGGGAPPPSRPHEVAQTFPNPGDLILAQGDVGAQVPQGWSFQLTIDTTGVPDDQLEKIPQLGIFRFRPRPGRVIAELPRGEHTARVETRAPGGAPLVTYSWSFRVGP
jgi:hypothetical protein